MKVPTSYFKALTPSFALPERPSGSRIGTFPGCMRFGELPTPINLVAGLLRLIAMVAEEGFNYDLLVNSFPCCELWPCNDFY